MGKAKKTDVSDDILWLLKQMNERIKRLDDSRLELADLVNRLGNVTACLEKGLKHSLDLAIGELRAVRWLLDRSRMFGYLDKFTVHIPPPPELYEPPVPPESASRAQ